MSLLSQQPFPRSPRRTGYHVLTSLCLECDAVPHACNHIGRGAFPSEAFLHLCFCIHAGHGPLGAGCGARPCPSAYFLCLAWATTVILLTLLVSVHCCTTMGATAPQRGCM